MASCIGCHRQIEDAYAFCPICGVDNRPPERRQPVTYCNHTFQPGLPCCTLCGAGYDEPAGSTPATRHRAVVSWMLGGFALVLLLAYVLIAGHTPGLPLSAQAHSLFSYTYRTYSRSSYSYSYHSYTTDLGTEISFALGVLAIGCFSQSYRLQKKLQTMDASDVAEWVWWQWFWF